MAETKPLSTADLPNKAPAVPSVDAAAEVAPRETVRQPPQPPVQPVARPANPAQPATEPAVKHDDPYPSQADADAIRQGRFRHGRTERDVLPESGAAVYKTR